MPRPSTYTDDIANRICERLAEGESLRSICTSEEFPAKSTIFKWLGENKEFSDQYARAREAQAETFYDELLSIADDGQNDWMEKQFGTQKAWVENGEALQRSRLRVDTRKWAMSKLLSRKYGDKVTNEHTGRDGEPLTIVHVGRA